MNLIKKKIIEYFGCREDIKKPTETNNDFFFHTSYFIKQTNDKRHTNYR